MATPDRPLPAANPTREEIARIEVGHTDVTPALARALVGVFLVLIAAVPAVEWARARAAGPEAPPPSWSQLGGALGDARAGLAGEAAPDGRWNRLVAANRAVLARLSAFERDLDDQSLIGRTLRRPAQVLMTGWLGAGNERVYPGREGWLFYRQDVEYATGPGFLEPARLRRRIQAAAEWTTPPQPDPRAAIERFHRDLAARGIALVVMPTPLKPGVHPEKLGRGYAAAAPVLHNPSYGALLAGLRQSGVLVFDAADALAAARRTAPLYLATDTHWLPETTELVAELLGEFLERHVPLPPVPDPGYQVSPAEVTAVGDTARMLDLPEGSGLVAPETVTVRRVRLPDGSPWRSSRTADVLLLGDSFSNIYALESMGWGTSAGLAEQLSHAMARPVDRLVQNDEGAFATRALLAQDAGRLDGTRVVVYQFAARELASGDWKILGIPPPGAGSGGR